MKKQLLMFPLLGLMASLLSGCGTIMFVYPDAEKYTAGNITYEDAVVNTINIDWISHNITLLEDENATGITIYEETSLTDENAFVHTYLHDGILEVKYFASGYICHVWNYTKDLTITYKPGLEKLNVNLTSGEFKANSIHADTFKLNLTSGRVNIDDIQSSNIDINMTSGNVAITNANTNTFASDLTSGTLRVGFETLEAGTIRLTSGTVEMALPESGGSVKVAKTSGSVTVNRECVIDDNTYKIGDGSANINVSMTSGDLTIN